MSETMIPSSSSQMSAALFPTTSTTTSPSPASAPPPSVMPEAVAAKALFNPMPGEVRPAPAPAQQQPAPPAQATQQGQQQTAQQQAVSPTDAVASMDQQMASIVTDAGKRAGLDDAAARKFLNEMAGPLRERAEQQAAAQREAWKAETDADRMVDPVEVDHTLHVFGDKALHEMLELSGIGQHPAFNRFVTRLGRALARRGGRA